MIPNATQPAAIQALDTISSKLFSEIADHRMWPQRSFGNLRLAYSTLQAALSDYHRASQRPHALSAKASQLETWATGGPRKRALTGPWDALGTFSAELDAINAENLRRQHWSVARLPLETPRAIADALKAMAS